MMKSLFHPVALCRLCSAWILVAGVLSSSWAQAASPSPAKGTAVAQPAVARPAMTPAPGDYHAPQQVAMKCSTPSAVIRYSLDGTTPAGPDEGRPYAGRSR